MMRRGAPLRWCGDSAPLWNDGVRASETMVSGSLGEFETDDPREVISRRGASGSRVEVRQDNDRRLLVRVKTYEALEARYLPIVANEPAKIRDPEPVLRRIRPRQNRRPT